jgi:general secretion pathway protein G
MRSVRVDGFTLVELMIVLAIIAILASLSAVIYADALEEARTTSAIAEIRMIEKEVMVREADGALPDSLSEIGLGGILDPWGHPYQYLNFATAPPGARRKDRFLVPLNTSFDLYSMGRDGKSKPPLTASDSHDDVVRAGDGGFVGPASEF